LEDCTGVELGVLPQSDDEYSDSETSSTEYEDAEEGDEVDDQDVSFERTSSGELVMTMQVPPLPNEGGDRVSELRELLEECRAMEQSREEGMFGFGGFGGPGGGGFGGGTRRVSLGRG
jgi:hypothetical protein